jgi:transposase
MEARMGKRTDAKQQALREQGSFNGRSKLVSDPLFLGGEFFDPRDLVQVKYEMLRRVQTDKHSVAAAAKAFGLSRPSFYQAQSAFEKGGLPALVRKRPGPRRAHKLSAEVLRFIDQRKGQDPSLRSSDLARLAQEKFDLAVHPRSIERALGRQKKKGR